MTDEVFYLQQDQGNESSDEIVYLRELKFHNWEGRVCKNVFVMDRVTKEEYISHLLVGNDYLFCNKNGKKWGIQNKLTDTWFVYTDTATYKVWHGKNHERSPEGHLFKFLIGTQVFAVTLADAPNVIQFLTMNFEELFGRNKPKFRVKD